MRYVLALLAALSVTITASANATDEPPRWPREITLTNGKLLVYEPQPDSLVGTQLWARAAVSIEPTGKAPVFGAIWVSSTLDIDRDSRIAHVAKVNIEGVRFPGTREGQRDTLAMMIEQESQKWDLSFSMDLLMTSLQANAADRAGSDLKNDPPKVVFVTYPAILVNIDGAPQVEKVPNTEVQQVVNTPFPIYQDPASKAYYLYGTNVWFTTSDLLNGEWRVTPNPPKAIADVIEQAKQQSAQSSDAAAQEAQPPPVTDLSRARIFVATTPTELIVADGEPKWSPIVSSELLTMSNTSDDVFMEVATQDYYVLLSGRWYRAKSMNGPWTHVPPPDLPKVFAQIPATSDKADVLAHVPGTDQAQDAMMDAIIPQTASVSRKDATFTVDYDGEPKFEPVTGTDIQYAVNTSKQVLKVQGKYYGCEEGVWYVSSTAQGPWAVSDQRPAGVDDIPANSPVSNTKYVYVYESTPDVVVVGYTPAYIGCYPYYGTVVFGTGWYYRPWISPYHYYPRPVTFGYCVHYGPYTGWTFGMSWGVGWASFSYGWGGGWHCLPGYPGYPRYYAGYHFHPGYPGYPGYRPGYPGYHPGTRYKPGYAARPYRHNLYSRPDNPNHAAVRPTRPGAGSARPNRPTTRPGVSNNVYTDREGNVYRNNGQQWQRHDRGQWKPANPGAGAASPTTRPSTQPVTRPGMQPSTQPVTRPGMQPSTQPVTRPGMQPSTQPVTRPTTQPSTRPGMQPAGRPRQPSASARGGASVESSEKARQRSGGGAHRR